MRHFPILAHDKQLERRQDDEYLAMPRPENGPAMHLSDYVQRLKKRKWWVIIPFCLAMALGLVLVVFQSPMYTATATLLIDDVNPKIAPVQEILPAESSPDFYNTQYQIIKGRTIVGKLVTQLQLDKQPPKEVSPVEEFLTDLQLVPKRLLKSMIEQLKERLGQMPEPAQSADPPPDPAEIHWLETVTDLQDRVQVSPRKDTKLVDIILQGPDSAVVKQVNTLAEIYINENLETKLAESRRATAWLQQEATTLRQKTEQSALAAERFKSGKDFLFAEDLIQRQYNTPQNISLQSTAVERLGRLNASYVEANTARLQLETQIAALKKLARRSVKEILDFPGITENPFLRTLKSKYYDAQLEYANLSQRFGPKHPRLADAKAAVDEVTRTIGIEIHNMIGQLGKDLSNLLAKEDMLAKELASQKTEVFSSSEDVRQYQTLRRDLAIDQDLHTAVSKRYAEAMLTEALTPNNIRIVERAMESEPVSQTLKTLLLNLILGLGLGVGLAFTREYFDKRFKTVDEVEQCLDLPCFGVIPHQRGARRLKTPITLQAPGSRIAEAYRTVRSWLQAPTAQPVKSLLITSAAPAEGKSTTATNLAVSVAQLGWRVLLVDADLRRPMLHRAFGLTRDQGLTDILVHGADWHEMLRDTALENLKMLPTGMTPPNPVDLLSTRRMQVLTSQLTRAFDLVIFDAPMVLSLPEVTILAPLMDGVLLVHSPRRTDRDVVLQAKQVLKRRGAPLLGVVLNDISDKAIPYYTRYGYADYYAPPLRRGRPDNGGAGKPIDMQPEENGDNWVPGPLAIPRSTATHTRASSIRKMARSGDLTLSILAVSLQQHLAEVESDPGWQFLVLDVELVNNATSPCTFQAEQTAIVVNPQSGYSQALTSLIELPSRRGAAVPFPQGHQVYQYDPQLTHKLADGLVGVATITAQGVKSGLLVYQIPLQADSYVFAYENEDSSCTIPLGNV